MKADAAASRSDARVWPVVAVSGLFGLLYAYAVWNAIGNLVASVQATSAQGLSLNALGWFLWLFAAVVPILVWTIAFGVGRRRPTWHLALLMLTGLGVVGVFWLNVIAYATVNTLSLIG